MTHYPLRRPQAAASTRYRQYLSDISRTRTDSYQQQSKHLPAQPMPGHEAPLLWQLPASRSFSTFSPPSKHGTARHSSVDRSSAARER